MSSQNTDRERPDPEINNYTLYHRYAYEVDCPHCGSIPGKACQEMDSEGPTGEWRSPHQERVEKAIEELFDPIEQIHAGLRMPVLDAIGEQASELHDQPNVTVTCPCGATGPIETAYRCFYCDVFFCPNCAEIHFADDRTPRPRSTENNTVPGPDLDRPGNMIVWVIAIVVVLLTISVVLPVILL